MFEDWANSLHYRKFLEYAIAYGMNSIHNLSTGPHKIIFKHYGPWTEFVVSEF